MDDISGNLTGLYIAEETTPKTLPVTPIWYEREPNSYSDFGATPAMLVRKPITHNRQNRKGSVIDQDVVGGWNEDLTPNNFSWLMQGFLFANAREKPKTKPFNGTERLITGVATSSDQYAAAAGLNVFLAGHIVFASGFTNAGNNGVKNVTASGATQITVSQNLTDEGSPPTSAKIEAVGFRFGSATMSLDVSADNLKLVSSTTNLTTLGLNVGEWVFIGGDATGLRFADSGNNAPFWGRIASIASGYIIFDKTTGTQVDDAGTGKTIEMYWPTSTIRNEDDCTLIKTRTYNLERQYGCGAGTVESEYAEGAIPNELTLHLPTPGPDAKVNLDLTFMALSSSTRDAGTGVKTGTRVAGLNEKVYNTSLDVYQHKLTVIDKLTLNPTALVGFFSEGTISINNNISLNKAIGVFGASGTNIGYFDVTGSLTGYFNGIAAANAVRNGVDLTWHLILTNDNTAVVFDVPLLSLGNGRANVEANTPVTLPLELAAAQGETGLTLLTGFYPYVPNVGMAS